MATVDGMLNPLALWHFEFADKVEGVDLSSSDNLLKDIVCDVEHSSLDDARERYAALTAEPHGILFAPNEKRILGKIVNPLRQAMVSFVLGNYVSTIAACGMVGEMVAMLVYDLLIFAKDDLPAEDRDKLTEFRAFQRKGQEKRIKHLMAIGSVSGSFEQPLLKLQSIRRRYLHFYLEPLNRIEEDALESWQSAVQTVKLVLAQKLRDGKLHVQPVLARYLSSKGVMKDETK